MKKLILLFALILSIKQSVAQTTYTWSGTTSTNWNTNTNWTPNGIPGITDHAIIVTGSNNCVLSTNTSVSNLTITSGTLNLNSFTLNSIGVVACNGGTCSNGTFNALGSTLTFAGTTFNANITAAVTEVYFSGSIFNGNVNVSKSGSGNAQSTGNNTFNGTTSITNSGVGYLMLANGTAGRNDIFNGPTTLNTTNSGNLYMGYARNATFNGNLTVNNTSGTGSTLLGANGGIITLGVGVTITCGTFAGATLSIYKLVQSDATALTLSTGTAGGIAINTSTITGILNVTAGNIYTQASIFNSNVVLNKTAGGHNESTGGNTFNGTLTMNHTGVGIFGMGKGARDIFNGDVFFNNTSANERIAIGENSSNNQFNGNITVTEGGAAQAIWLGLGGTPPVISIASGKVINVSPTTFTAGALNIYGLVQSGTTPLSYTVGTNAGLGVYTSTINGALNLTGGNIYTQGSTYNDNVILNKNGGGHNESTGGNIFNGTLTMNHTGVGIFGMGKGTRDIFNGDVFFNNTSANERIAIGENSSNNEFNGNINVTEGGAAQAIWLGLGGTPPVISIASGKVINVSPTTFTAGALNIYGLVQAGTTPLSYTVGTNAGLGVYTSTINGTLNLTGGNIYTQGSTYNDNVILNKNGGGHNESTGGNIFNGTLTMNHTGVGIFGMEKVRDIFNGDVFFNNTSSNERIAIGENSSNNEFNGNINVTEGGAAQAIWLGLGGTPPVISIASGKVINVSPTTYTAGMLNIYGLVQAGATPLSYTVGTNAGLGVYTSTINGALTLTGGNIYTQSSTYNDNVILNKNGGGHNESTGGNIFNGTLTMNHTGVGIFGMGKGTRDIFNGDVFFNNTSANERIAIGENSSNNQFNGNITVTEGGAAQAIWLGFGGTVPVITIAPGKVINVSPTTYTAGMLNIYGLVQSGTTPLSYTVGTNAGLGVYTSTINGALTLTGGNIYTQLSTYNDNVIFNKNGGGHNESTGGNIFNGTLTMNHTGVGIFGMGKGTRDIFNGDVFFNNTSANERIAIGENSSNNQFNGNITVTEGGAAQAIWLGFGGTVPVITIAPGKVINVSPTTYTAGMLNIYGLTQSGTTPLSYTVGTNAGLGVYTSTINGALTLTGGNIYTQTSIFNDNVILNKNGSAGNASTGGNTFNSSLTINNSGTNYIGEGNGTRDIYNGDLFLNNTSNERIIIGQNSTNNLFNGNVYVSSTGSAQNIWLGFGGTYPVVTLAAGKTVAVGAGGFTAGGVTFYRFAQSDATPITLTGTGSSGVTVTGNSTFMGITNFNAGNIYANGGIFNAATSFTKTSSTANISDGGNTFNDVAAFTNTGTGIQYLANVSSDAYNSDASFTQNNTGALYPNYATNCTYKGNVSVAGSGTYTITFGNSTGTATFNGGLAQSINRSGSVSFPVFTRLISNKSANDITLNTRVNITGTLTLTQGIFNTTSANILNMNNLAITTIGNASSYINGPMNYDMALSGSRTLNFPIGKAADWRPATLVAAHSNATSYTYNAELTNASANSLGWTKPATIDLTSLVHYWDINRSVTATGAAATSTNVSGNQTITLYYGTNDGVPDPSFLTIVKNTSGAPTTWFDIGGTGATAGAGSVTSSSAPTAFTSYSRFTLGNRIGGTNPLPIELLSFTAQPVNNTVSLDWATASEANNSYYDIERSADGINFEYVTTVKAYGNGNSLYKQTYNAIDKAPYKGISYYRLKQVDKNGAFTYAKVVSVEFKTESYVNVFPNPTSGILMIKASENYSTASLKIINAIGVEVILNAQMVSYNGRIDVSDLAAGIYYVVIENGDATENIKISIQK